MVYDTVRQKFIYNTPFDRREYPKVTLDTTTNFKNPYYINATSLYLIEEENFEKLVEAIKASKDSVIIKNDYSFESKNRALLCGAKCHILAFAYLFKEKGLFCGVES